MSPQGIVTKIIINPIKRTIKGKFLNKNKSVAVVGLISLLVGMLIQIQWPSALVRNMNVYAQPVQISDPISETLNEAQTKVAIATSPGAFGHGVPSIYNIPLQEFLLALGIAGAVIISIYFAVELLLRNMNKKVTAYQ